jgi:hypothetical protein
MTESAFEEMNEQIDEAAQMASRAAHGVADALEDGVNTAKSMARRGRHNATEFLDDARRHVKRRPIGTIAAIFAAGVAAGAAIGWMIRRRDS